MRGARRLPIWLLAAVMLAACGQRVPSEHAAAQLAAASPTVASPSSAPTTPPDEPAVLTQASDAAEERGVPTPLASQTREPTAPSGRRDDEPSDPRGTELWGRSFVSVAVTEDGQPKALVPGTSIRVEFERRDDGGVVRWWLGCNTHGARVVISADRLDLEATSLGGTAVGCDEERHEQDGWASRFFSADPHWRISGGRLVLTVDDDVIDLRETESRGP